MPSSRSRPQPAPSLLLAIGQSPGSSWRLLALSLTLVPALAERLSLRQRQQQLVLYACAVAPMLAGARYGWVAIPCPASSPERRRGSSPLARPPRRRLTLATGGAIVARGGGRRHGLAAAKGLSKFLGSRGEVRLEGVIGAARLVRSFAEHRPQLRGAPLRDASAVSVIDSRTRGVCAFIARRIFGDCPIRDGRYW